MPSLDMLTVYATDVEKSTAFYEDVLEKPVIQTMPGFAIFNLKTGLNFGIWAKNDVAPRSDMVGGATEVAFSLPDNDAVEHLYARWKDKDIAIIQEPTVMDFGYTFTALDPDGNRLRLFAPSQR